LAARHDDDDRVSQEWIVLHEILRVELEMRGDEDDLRHAFLERRPQRELVGQEKVDLEKTQRGSEYEAVRCRPNDIVP
jgi:hypothetical protein